MTHLLSTLDPLGGLHSAWSFLYQGGIFMIPLGLGAIIGVMAILYKALSLTTGRIIPAQLAASLPVAQEKIGAGLPDPVLGEIGKGRSVLARLCGVAVKYRGKDEARITRAVEAAAREEAVHLQSGIGVLDVIITVAPLLGLLGTASGLITIFQNLGETADQVGIARGISEALSTTIMGLAIAVPCVIAQGYFQRRIDTLTARLESLLTEFIQACQKPDHHA